MEHGDNDGLSIACQRADAKKVSPSFPTIKPSECRQKSAVRKDGQKIIVAACNTGVTVRPVKVESENPLTFRPPPDVRAALSNRKAAGENVSALIIRAIRRLLKLKAP